MVEDRCVVRGFEKLLVATDGSAFSDAAIQEALDIAGSCSSKLYVVHIIETGVEVELWDRGVTERLENEMGKYLSRVQAAAKKKGVSCEVVMHLGEEPYRIIVAEAKKLKVGTIIMGSHGRTGLPRLMMGSTVTRVIGHAPCKVLIVPGKKGK
ncbi:MAG TPA: universal stress protein [Nitrospirota bacterium]|nr:universal stress protein [Nitrospirota bacterium]